MEIEIHDQPLPHQVSAETELQLLRITQEALANVYKHAEVDRARVSLQTHQEYLTLTIEDSGAGFEPGSNGSKGGSGYGMATMSERAAAIGAELTIESSPDQGTRIHLRAPLESR